VVVSLLEFVRWHNALMPTVALNLIRAAELKPLKSPDESHHNPRTKAFAWIEYFRAVDGMGFGW
jgi:hypothetical protein